MRFPVASGLGFAVGAPVTGGMVAGTFVTGASVTGFFVAGAEVPKRVNHTKIR